MPITPLTDLKPSLTDAPQSALVGPSPGAKTRSRSGRDLLKQPPAVAIMAFGDKGTGKTKILFDLLKLGLKVVDVQTDYGASGIETVVNACQDHPEEAPEDLLDRLRLLEGNYEGIVNFMHDPLSAYPDLYKWDPDVIFWDGLTAFQENDVEGYVNKTAKQLQNDSGKDWDGWRSARNGTVFPLHHFLRMKNLETGKPWHKVATCLEDKIWEYEKVKTTQGKDDRSFIPGSERIMPMLHTTARKIATAGFGLTFRTTKTHIGQKDVFAYQFKGSNLDTKDRGYNVPNDMKPADFSALWTKFIQPHLQEK